MWKWIVGIALVIVIGIVALGYWGYHKLTAGGDMTSVTVHASADRTWRLLMDSDSISVWLKSMRVIAGHHGELAPGDTLHLASANQRSGRSTNVTWIVGQVVPGKVRELQLVSDSTHTLVATRRDSLVAAGDSTTIIATIASPFLDSIGVSRADSGKRAGAAAMGMASKLMISAFRLMADQELKELQSWVNSDAGAPAAAAKP